MASNDKLVLSVKNIVDKFLNDFETMPEEALKLRITKKPKANKKEKITKLTSYPFVGLKPIEVPNIQFYLKKKCGESTEGIPKFIIYDHPKDVKKDFKNAKMADEYAIQLADFIYKLSNVLINNITQYANKTIIDEKFLKHDDKKIDMFVIREQFIIDLMKNIERKNPLIWNRIEQTLKKELDTYNKLMIEYHEKSLLKSKMREDKQKAKQLLQKEVREKEKQAIKEAHEKGEVYTKTIKIEKKEKTVSSEKKHTMPNPPEFMISSKENNKEIQDYFSQIMKIKAYYHKLSSVIGFIERFIERKEALKKEFSDKTPDERLNMNLFELYGTDNKKLYNELIYKELASFPISSSFLTDEHKKILTTVVELFEKRYLSDKKLKHETRVVELIDKFSTFKKDYAAYQKAPQKTKQGKEKVFSYKKNQVTNEFFALLKEDKRCEELVTYVETEKDNRFMRLEPKEKKVREKNYEHNLPMIPILKQMFDSIPSNITKVSINNTSTEIKISHGAFIMINNVVNAMFNIILDNIVLALSMKKNTSLVINDDIYTFTVNAFMKDIGVSINILNTPDYYTKDMFIKH